MLKENTILITDVVHEAANPLVGDIDDYDPLMNLIGESFAIRTMPLPLFTSRCLSARSG